MESLEERQLLSITPFLEPVATPCVSPSSPSPTCEVEAIDLSSLDDCHHAHENALLEQDSYNLVISVQESDDALSGGASEVHVIMTSIPSNDNALFVEYTEESGFNPMGDDAGKGNDELPTYNFGMTVNEDGIVSGLSDLGENPLIERFGREVGKEDVNPFEGVNYLRFDVPPLPDGYTCDVVFSSDSATFGIDYNVVIRVQDGTYDTLTRDVALSTPCVYNFYSHPLEFYIVPKNDSLAESNETINATLNEPVASPYPPLGFVEYDFVGEVMTVTATIIDDDQWVVQAKGIDSEVEILEPCDGALSFEDSSTPLIISRVPNEQASAWIEAFEGYTLDDTYSVNITLSQSGTALRGGDYDLLYAGTDTSVFWTTLTIRENETEVPLTVLARHDRFYENDETIVYGIESAKTPSRNSLDIDPATTTITIIQAPEFFDPDQEGDQPAQVNNDHLHLPLIPFPPAKPDGTYAPFYIPWAPASRGSNIVFREIDDPHNWFTIDSTTGGIFVTPEFIVARENGVEEAFGELQYTFAASDETIPYGSSEFCDHLTVTFRFENWNVGVEALASEAAEANGRSESDCGSYMISRTGETNASNPLSVHLSVDGSASEDDYELYLIDQSSGERTRIYVEDGELTVVIPAGVYSVVVELDPVDDTIAENDEVVILRS
ncbi:MAG: hypothetical protein ACOX0A_10455 [Thermoguttaceae bacterium]|jgi:hypothetical protein